MCWYTRASDGALLIRAGLEKNHGNLVGLSSTLGALRLVFCCISERQKKAVIADRFNNLGVFFLFAVAFHALTL